ncbi:hypothetical protein DND58_01195 [Pseudomonas syringae pv. pisi]|nr:hypothetical protein N032_09990 [Pseudomonas syringae pv. pisi str. PP1]PYD15747.1 hypothetical protein DND62_06240 [Pseudomonas syringae pv. pisi]PYD34259.1 hypothetical protein DND58_01195 [Pseudomonas syringae pv. pisi]PYD35733.1 hypothetical protein DND67_03485 [Pseudomonas syringae pv. pisi]
MPLAVKRFQATRKGLGGTWRRGFRRIRIAVPTVLHRDGHTQCKRCPCADTDAGKLTRVLHMARVWMYGEIWGFQDNCVEDRLKIR